MCKCKNPVPDHEYSDMCGKCGKKIKYWYNKGCLYYDDEFEYEVMMLDSLLEKEMEKHKCGGDCGMNYCDENGCQDDKHPTGSLFEKPK